MTVYFLKKKEKETDKSSIYFQHSCIFYAFFRFEGSFFVELYVSYCLLFLLISIFYRDIKKKKFCIFQAAKHLGQECGATVESVHFGLMKYSLDLWSAKMASDAEIPFACFMAGGKDTGQKINCFKEIFKSVSFTCTFFASHRIPFVEAGKPCYITFCRSSVCRRREGCNLPLVSEGQGRAQY